MKILIFLMFLISYTNSQIPPKTGFQEKRVEILSKNYMVEWQANFDDETIVFNVTVKTKGFVGFGLSHSGGMHGADIVIGGLNNDGTTYFKDYYGLNPENGFPKEDFEQNWELLNAYENELGFTFLSFTRKLDTCDPNHEDIEITAGTIKIIWSYGPTDTLSYHGGSNRGDLAVNMLDQVLPPTDLDEFKQTNYVKRITMPRNATTNWCSMFKHISTEKTHIVAFKPKLDTPESLAHTHHFNVYTCEAPDGENPNDVFGRFADPTHPGQDCVSYTTYDPIPTGYCNKNLYAWSLGGRLLVFPKDVGLPWGTGRTQYFYIDVHLNNPDGLENVSFETGITVYDTHVLRKHEAAILTISHATRPSLLIPPNTKDWTIVGHCSSACTQENLPSHGINIFNINLHAHLSGSKMRVRQFRNGTELPWITNDETYDPNYQENRPFQKSIHVRPGDQISLECTYDSTWKAPEAVLGGVATTDEMCMLFAIYYPKLEFESCGSSYPVKKILRQFGITEVTSEYVPDPIIERPRRWAGRTFSDILRREIKWTEEFKTKLQTKLLKDYQDDLFFLESNVTYPVVEDVYKPEHKTCELKEKKFNSAIVAFVLIAVVLFALLSFSGFMIKKFWSSFQDAQSPNNIRYSKLIQVTESEGTDKIEDSRS